MAWKQHTHEWEYDNPVVWGTDARNAHLYIREPREELQESMRAVRRHFTILSQGMTAHLLDTVINARRINDGALALLPLQYTTFTSSSYVSDSNLVLRGEQPRNGLVAMLTALEKAAIERARQ